MKNWAEKTQWGSIDNIFLGNKSLLTDSVLNVLYTLTIRFLSHTGLFYNSYIDYDNFVFNDFRKKVFLKPSSKIFTDVWIYLCTYLCPAFSCETKTRSYRGTITIYDLMMGLDRSDKLERDLYDRIEKKLDEQDNDSNILKKRSRRSIYNDSEIKRIISEIKKRAEEEGYNEECLGDGDNESYPRIYGAISELPQKITLLGQYFPNNSQIVLYVKSILKAYTKDIFIEIVEELCKKLKKYPKDKDSLDEFEKICLNAKDTQEAIDKILSSNLLLEDLVDQHLDICGVIVAKFYSITYTHELIHCLHFVMGANDILGINQVMEPQKFGNLFAEEIWKEYNNLHDDFRLKRIRDDLLADYPSMKSGSNRYPFPVELLLESVAYYFEILYLKYINEYGLASMKVFSLIFSSIMFPYRGALVFYKRQFKLIMDNQASRYNKYDFVKKYIVMPDVYDFEAEYCKSFSLQKRRHKLIYFQKI